MKKEKNWVLGRFKEQENVLKVLFDRDLRISNKEKETNVLFLQKIKSLYSGFSHIFSIDFPKLFQDFSRIFNPNSRPLISAMMSLISTFVFTSSTLAT